MADSQSRPDADYGSDVPAHPGVPRWVKVFGTVAGSALLVAFVLMHTVGGGMGGH
ncbi:hypothetical protein OHS71_08625 [Streptomyces sp. NBC_00377]|uniref:hypothetical protein n=1 Tax=unclassified Streptomyces TaxID=2593676 RepID=UPI002E1A1D1D|nr:MULTISPECIES: hypothetical protein [unclassified Streptomyces]